MIRILLASHSDLAESLLKTGRMICGCELMQNITTLSLQENGKGIEELKKNCTLFYEQYKDDSFLIMVDIVGASPFNVCASVFKNANCSIVCGMNLPMLIDTAIKKNHSSLEELASSAEKAGLDGIKNIHLHTFFNTGNEEEDFL